MLETIEQETGLHVDIHPQMAKPENTNYAVYGFILPSYSATPCRKTKVCIIKKQFLNYAWIWAVLL